jgi:cleavage stimulation factor subunit 3
MTTLSPEMEFLQSLKGDTSEPVKPADAQPDEDDDDYDPSSFVAPSKESSASILTSKAAAKPTRFKAGFEIDDDEEEQEEDQMGNHSGFNGTAFAGDKSSSGTPANALSIHTADVSIPKTDGQSVQESNSLNVPASSQFDARASTPPKPLTIPQSPSTTQYKTAEPSSATAAFFQRARLPQDRVGLLEDRIAEDPRGDIDAWLELIAEHRSRNRIDQAREVYQRFFSIFPTAVCALYFRNVTDGSR